MANRYWIGGDGNIGDTAHWSATSGGAGGVSVPTSSDNVFFDSNSRGGAAPNSTFSIGLDQAFNCFNLHLQPAQYDILFIQDPTGTAIAQVYASYPINIYGAFDTDDFIHGSIRADIN